MAGPAGGSVGSAVQPHHLRLSRSVAGSRLRTVGFWVSGEVRVYVVMAAFYLAPPVLAHGRIGTALAMCGAPRQPGAQEGGSQEGVGSHSHTVFGNLLENFQM